MNNGTGRRIVRLTGLLLLAAVLAACSNAIRGQDLPPPGDFGISAIVAGCSAENVPTRLISWTASEGAESYLVLRDGEQLAEVKAEPYAHTDSTPLAPGASATYVVRAVNAGGTTDSAPVGFTAPAEGCSVAGEDPEEPGEPEEPGDPEEPGVPGDPGDPEEPGDPEDPEDPGAPEDPEEPGEPEDPEDPGEPTDPEDPGDPTDPEEPGDPTDPGEPGDPEEPELDPPGPVGSMHIELHCEPFGRVFAEWDAVEGATSYTLLQGDAELYQEVGATGGPGSAEADLIPGQPFRFTLQAGNDAGTVESTQLLPATNTCMDDHVLLAAGRSGVMMVDPDGDVWAWGEDGDHLPGTRDAYLPAPDRVTDGPRNVRKLLLGDTMGLAVTRDGHVEVWGSSSDGMLGLGGVTVAEAATEVPGLSGIVDAAVGMSHVLAVDEAGQVWIWGTFLGRLIPVPEAVPLAEGIINVAAGIDTAYALRTDGSVVAWGSNRTADVLGLGEAADFTEPVQVPGIFEATALFAAHHTMFFRRADFSIAGLGRSMWRAEGGGVTGFPDLGEIEALSIGRDFVLGVARDGKIIGWGRNDSGQLGRPYEESDTYELPEEVRGIPPAVAVFAGERFSVAVDRDGRVHTWGRNNNHQLGMDAIRSSDTFTRVPLPEEIIAVESGTDFVLALGLSGRVYSWGANATGQLGRGTGGRTDWAPAQIADLSGVVQIATGRNFGLAQDALGRVHAWGYAAEGALGDGSVGHEFRARPGLSGYLNDIVKIAAGSDHALALDSDGRIWSWGSGLSGALGLGDEQNRAIPEQVGMAEGTVINDIAAGQRYSLFIANGFAVGGFGQNSSLQLGDEVASGDRELLPVPIGMSLGGLKHVFAGVNTGFTVSGQDDLFAWGGNSGRIKGCCADGVPGADILQVPGVTDIGLVAAGRGHAIFLDTVRGIAYGIGHNVDGQLGLPTPNAYSGPQEIPVSGTVTHAAVGSVYSVMVIDGEVYASGRNLHGILGRAPLHNIPQPVMPDAPPVAMGGSGD